VSLSPSLALFRREREQAIERETAKTSSPPSTMYKHREKGEGINNLHGMPFENSVIPLTLHPYIVSWRDKEAIYASVTEDDYAHCL
jgi:hypothetical protein